METEWIEVVCTMVAAWSVCSIAGIGVFALPWQAGEIRESVSAFRAAKQLFSSPERDSRSLARGVAIAGR